MAALEWVGVAAAVAAVYIGYRQYRLDGKQTQLAERQTSLAERQTALEEERFARESRPDLRISTGAISHQGEGADCYVYVDNSGPVEARDVVLEAFQDGVLACEGRPDKQNIHPGARAEYVLVLRGPQVAQAGGHERIYRSLELRATDRGGHTVTRQP
jgi:hypothetical protein